MLLFGKTQDTVLSAALYGWVDGVLSESTMSARFGSKRSRVQIPAPRLSSSSRAAPWRQGPGCPLRSATGTSLAALATQIPAPRQINKNTAISNGGVLYGICCVSRARSWGGGSRAPYGSLKVDMIWSKTAVSATGSKRGGGVSLTSGATDHSQKVRLMQALPLAVEYAVKSPR